MSTLPDVVQSWRSSAEALLEVAESAAPMTDQEFTRSFTPGEDPEAVIAAKVEDFLEKSSATLRTLKTEKVRTLGAGQGPAAGTMETLLFDLEVAEAILAASEAPGDGAAGPATARGNTRNFKDTRARLNALEASVLGTERGTSRLRAAAADGSQPGATLDGIQNAGADELWALGQDATVVGALGAGVKSLANLGGKNVKDAFEKLKKALSGGLNWLKRASVRILEWVIARLRKLVPESARARFDELVEAARDKLKDGVKAQFSALLGSLLGRKDVESAWAAATDTADAEAKLESVTAGHLERIGYISTARTFAENFGTAIPKALVGAPGPVQVAVGALVVAVIVFVGYQVFDGFNDVEALVRPGLG